MRPGHAFGQRGLARGGFSDGDDLRLGQESFGLRRPVRDDGGRRDHEEGRERLDALTALGGTFGGGAVLLHRVGEQCESLHGLTQTHVVGEDTAHAMLVQEGEPAVALHLVGAQGGAQARGHRVLPVQARACRASIVTLTVSIGACRGLILALCGVGFMGLGGLHERQQGTHLLVPAAGGLHARCQRLQLRE